MLNGSTDNALEFSHPDRPDAILLFVFDIEMDFVFDTEIDGCAGCCHSPTSTRSYKVHAHLDHALRLLYLFSDIRVFHLTLDDQFRHKQQDAYLLRSLRGGVFLPEFFQEAGRQIVQVSSASQIPFALYTQMTGLEPVAEFEKYRHNWQSFHVLSERGVTSDLGVLHVAYTGQDVITGIRRLVTLDFISGVTVSPSKLEYATFFNSAQILQELKRQIMKRHYKGVDATNEGDFQAMRLQGFSVMNNRKRINPLDDTAHADKTDMIHMLLSHVQNNKDILRQENDVLHDQILSLVQVNISSTGVPTVTVRLMTILTHKHTETAHSFFYSLMPYAVDQSAPNVIMAKSVVVATLQRGNRHTVQLSNFSCLLCGVDLYDEATESCLCRAGTVPVCLPCSTECAAGRFVVDPDADRCYTATNALIGQALPNQRHNLICMACSGVFFCKDGTVRGIEQCPSSRPLTLKSNAVGDFDCACAPGFAYSNTLDADYTVQGALLQHNIGVSRFPKQIFVARNATEECSICPDTLLCSPIYTQHSHSILCPAHTKSKTQHVAMGGPRPDEWTHLLPENSDDSAYTNVYQGCFCDDGYYRTTPARTTCWIAPILYTSMHGKMLYSLLRVSRATQGYISASTCVACVKLDGPVSIRGNANALLRRAHRQRAVLFAPAARDMCRST